MDKDGYLDEVDFKKMKKHLIGLTKILKTTLKNTKSVVFKDHSEHLDDLLYITKIKTTVKNYELITISPRWLFQYLKNEPDTDIRICFFEEKNDDYEKAWKDILLTWDLQKDAELINEIIKSYIGEK